MVKNKAFIFLAQESLWRLTWSILVKLLINTLILGVVVARDANSARRWHGTCAGIRATPCLAQEMPGIAQFVPFSYIVF